jgi:hypothetical protein
MMTQAALAELLDHHPLDQLVRKYGVHLRTSARGHIGPCPLCSTDLASRTATRFEIREDRRHWVCAVCQSGGDVIELVRRRERCTFQEAVTHLLGTSTPKRTTAWSITSKKCATAKEHQIDRANAKEAERRQLYRRWRTASPLQCSSAENYLRARGIRFFPRTLRCVEAAPYFHGQSTDEQTGQLKPRIIYWGPVMLGGIIRSDGTFGGLHYTYLEPHGRSKARLTCPDTGEPLSAKKIRGSKEGAVLKLSGPANPVRLFIGEGIETVLSVADELGANSDDASTDAFWAMLDVGNLGGRALHAVEHPTRTLPNGRPARVPGPLPDLEATAISMPASVCEIIILCDADCDRFLVENAAMRCAARYRAEHRKITWAWARAGSDFNDMLQAERI